MYTYYICLFIFCAFRISSCNICSTPEEWQEVANLNYRKWPNATVKYHLNSSLTLNDTSEVLAAFEEYHKKTCVRFVPRNEADSNYVSIEVDNNVCGMANVCMTGGQQFAKFGNECRRKNTMVHQLGHTLCMEHADHHLHEDKFISYKEKCNFRPQSLNRSRIRRPVKSIIYDLASQMHNICDSQKQCGYQITSGLSVIDVDYINAMYNCQGCFRHRWIPIDSITISEVSDMRNFGHFDLNGNPIYPCRAYFKGVVSIGKFNRNEGSCYLGFYSKEYKLCEQFEVLIIPGGESREGIRESDAYLRTFIRHTVHDITVSDQMSVSEQDAIFNHAVVAGYLPWADGNGYGTGYIGFGFIPNIKTSCEYRTTWWKGDKERSVDVIGRVWRYLNGSEAHFALCEKEFHRSTYHILTCRAVTGKASLSTPSTTMRSTTTSAKITTTPFASTEDLLDSFISTDVPHNSKKANSSKTVNVGNENTYFDSMSILLALILLCILVILISLKLWFHCSSTGHPYSSLVVHFKTTDDS